MNGTTQQSAAQFGPYTGWSVLSGDADFNADGMVMDFVEAKAAIREAIKNYDHYHLNEVPPFDRLNPTTALVLFERALRNEKGLYQVINWETARAIAAQGLTFINREEDLGDPGLRRAKLSYHPVRLEAKHTLTLRR